MNDQNHTGAPSFENPNTLGFMHYSLSGRIIFLFLVGMVEAVMLFCVLHALSEDMLDEYFITSDYIYRSEQPYITLLQRFINENGVSSGDSEKLDAWIKETGVQYLMVSRDRTVLYDSMYAVPSSSGGAQTLRVHQIWQFFCPVTFADGVADVFIYNRFEERFHLVVTAAELFISIFFWIAIVLIALRKEVRFIMGLNEKVSRFSQGEEVDFVSPERSDELGNLAKALGRMSGELKKKEAREASMRDERNRLLTGLAHDIRTPLAGLLASLDLARKKTEEPHVCMDYIDESYRKAMRIRDLSDQLFDSFRIFTLDKIELEPPAPVKNTVGDFFSEFYEELTLSGYDVRVEQICWNPVCVCINYGFMTRIMSNLVSNIRKYADPGAPVSLITTYTDKKFSITIVNAKKSNLDLAITGQAHGIGTRNIEGMMKLMGGDCLIDSSGMNYLITLVFPVLENADEQES